MAKKLILIFAVAMAMFWGSYYLHYLQVNKLESSYKKSVEICESIPTNNYLRYECEYDGILKILRESNKNNILGSTIFNTTGELIDLSSGKSINLSFSGLNNYQLDVFNAHNLYEASKENLENDSYRWLGLYSFVLLMGLLFFNYVIPSAWYFILDRIKELMAVIRK
jgi:hypothetical protein